MPDFVQQQIPLAPRTTLGVGGDAEYFAEVETLDALEEVVAWARAHAYPITVLAGGSNVLIRDEGIQGLVVVPKFSDIEFRAEGNLVYVTAGSGLVLDELIQTLIDKELWGLENLSAIPGSVGAVPIQNVGAYGVEASQILDSVSVFNMETQEIEVLNTDECLFGYRDSVFKKPAGKKYIVISVTFRVSTEPSPNIEYKDVQKYFGDTKNPSLREIRDAITSIRSKKFPDWHTWGTAGSFFKNPIIPKTTFVNLQNTYADMPGYELPGEMVKVPLGWVLDHICGLRGYEKGKVGLYKNQALVLVCEKGIASHEVESFAQEVSDTILNKTGITVEREVTTLP